MIVICVLYVYVFECVMRVRESVCVVGLYCALYDLALLFPCFYFISTFCQFFKYYGYYVLFQLILILYLFSTLPAQGLQAEISNCCYNLAQSISSCFTRLMFFVHCPCFK